jgi:hypothetical protein
LAAGRSADRQDANRVEWVYAPSPDDQRFLVNESVADDAPLLVVTLDWSPEPLPYY